MDGRICLGGSGEVVIATGDYICRVDTKDSVVGRFGSSARSSCRFLSESFTAAHRVTSYSSVTFYDVTLFPLKTFLMTVVCVVACMEVSIDGSFHSGSVAVSVCGRSE